MKSFIVGLIFLSLTSLSWAQEKKSSVKERGDKLPEVVIETAGEEFSVYLPDNNQDKTVRKVEDTFIAYRLGKDFEGYENYMVFFKIKDGNLNAYYNENGKLVKTVERYGRTVMPKEVHKTLSKKFPGWMIANDNYLYSQEDGEILKKEYHIILKKDKDIHKLTVTSNGEIVAR